MLEQRSLADPDWWTVQCAVGARNGHAYLNVSDEAELGSLLPQTELGLELHAARAEQQEPVPLRRLDWGLLDEVVDGIPDPRVFLKTDVQGFDLEVVNGTKGALEQVAGVQLELEVGEPIYSGAAMLDEGFTAMEELGYEATGIFPGHQDKRTLRLHEVDCLFRRRDGQSRTAATARRRRRVRRAPAAVARRLA